MMLGPSQQILELFSSLCDRWPRCQKAYAEFNRTQKDDFSLGTSCILGTKLSPPKIMVNLGEIMAVLGSNWQVVRWEIGSSTR